MSNKYTPGQRLNTVAEVFAALEARHRLSYDGTDGFIYMGSSGSNFDQNGIETGLFLHAGKVNKWSIYTPPKRKVKSERWFAVVADQYNSDSVSWRGPYLVEAETRDYHPNALTYVKAECEVEVPNDD